MKQLAYHFYGNYFAQALLAVAAHARDAAACFAAVANPDIARAARTTFSALMRQLQGEAADMACHPQAGFVLELLLERCDLEEVGRLTDELGAAFVDILQHKWGSKMLQRLISRMVRMHADPACLCRRVATRSGPSPQQTQHPARGCAGRRREPCALPRFADSMLLI